MSKRILEYTIYYLGRIWYHCVTYRIFKLELLWINRKYIPRRIKRRFQDMVFYLTPKEAGLKRFFELIKICSTREEWYELITLYKTVISRQKKKIQWRAFNLLRIERLVIGARPGLFSAVVETIIEDPDGKILELKNSSVHSIRVHKAINNLFRKEDSRIEQEEQMRIERELNGGQRDPIWE